MSDQSAPAVHGAVAAVLTATPGINRDDDVVFHGDVDLTAAEQAATVLRWASHNFPVGFDRAPWRWLLDQADKIEGASR